MKHYKSLHARVIILTIEVLDEPYVAVSQRLKIEPLNQQFMKVGVFFGFMDEPNLPAASELGDDYGLHLNPMDTSFFLGRKTLIPRIGSEMAYWREKVFIAIFRNSPSPAAYFQIPLNRIVELGSQVVL